MKKIILSLVTVILFSTLVSPISYAISSDDFIIERTDEVVVFNETEKLLMAIENIPDEVIEQGAERTAEWLQNETGIRVSVENEENLVFDLPEEQRRVITDPVSPEYPIVSPGYPIVSPGGPVVSPDFNLYGCISAVGIAIVTNALPLTKITKVKSALKALGGTSAAIKKIKKRYDIYRYGGFSMRRALQKALDDVSSSLSSTLKSAFLDFFNLTNIIANCGFAFNNKTDRKNTLSSTPVIARNEKRNNTVI